MDVIKLIKCSELSTAQEDTIDNSLRCFNDVLYSVINDIVVIRLLSIIKVEIKGVFTLDDRVCEATFTK